jgi:hypothetical protein
MGRRKDDRTLSMRDGRHVVASPFVTSIQTFAAESEPSARWVSAHGSSGDSAMR